ncbi:Outer envelope pore protein 21 [Medicago truncatula]|uniref:Outer envelope pore protein n=1 Tax=Medicago truncatula TaxID=3880 RepID=G7J5Z3_MEDTR|nr:outer envelope pore protein 21, chloroplastic [Medicago truncatula]AES74111.1 outer envelope pore protein [Medicago truncatula]AFK34074.1 unknown [Medicago truncatula]RHN71256.1 Outer envelope pore protein 21 [Medicago truncatula]
METSLRYGGDSKALKIHAKQKIRIDTNTFFQVRGELDTKNGQPNSLRALVRHFYPDLSATLGVGVQYDKLNNVGEKRYARNDKLRYTVLAKKTFLVTEDGLVNFKIKGACDVDQDFKERKSRGGAEFSWNIFNFQKDQDVRLRIGYEAFEQVPYVQIRENNWTFNADYKGRWNVRYDL